MQPSRPTPTYGSNTRVLPEDFEPTPHDVVCQRGKFALEHEGNIRFRGSIKEFLPRYSAAVHKWEKTAIVTTIVQKFICENESVGFVRKINDRWHEVGEQAAREKVGQTIRDLLHDKYRSSTRAKALRKKIPDNIPKTTPALTALGDLPDQRKLHGPQVDPEKGNLPDQRSLHGLRLDFKRQNTPDGKWEASFAKQSKTSAQTPSPRTNVYREFDSSESQRSVGHDEEYSSNAMLHWKRHQREEASILKERAGEDTNEHRGASSSRKSPTALAQFSNILGNTGQSGPKSKLPSNTVFTATPNHIERDINAALDSLFPPPDPAALDAFSIAAFEALLRGR